jgi:hypothetical protein
VQVVEVGVDKGKGIKIIGADNKGNVKVKSDKKKREEE